MANHLRTSILTLRLAPGEDLDETALTDVFGLSRTPLREVFRELAGEGYLEIRSGRGARVAEMSHTTLREFFLAAPMIYGAVLRLAADNALPRQIEQLRTSQTVFKQALRSGSSAERALANTRFHEITGEMAHNVYLLPSFRRLLIDHARIGMTFYEPQNNQMADNLTAASDQHDAIITAIAEGDAHVAGALADEHWQLSRDQIEMFVMPTSLDVPLGTLPQSIA
ncbi:GntR family transcriptional regulator [Thalassococcus lentus]|uniref:GntR family transcriptional regulator n=1 Tax=Thalassococcus lentus TaxID=1210524 RepID=A0ABT4XW76_9RHOB|nr:GntR family transcriptional regulator [Thalassococcus lentus]MDA7426218.1 GntR family transcriptional regulator [Thalassococcus lentus]